MIGLEMEAVFKSGLSSERAGDIEGAMASYREAAESGYLEAMAYLGYKYFSGKGIKRDYGQAFRWCSAVYERVCDILTDPCDEDEIEPYLDTIIALGEMYERGNGVDASIDEAIKCYKLAAEYQEGDAMRRLGYIYYDAADYKNAFYWFDMAGEDYYFSDFMLAEKYFHIDKKYTEALKWYKAAASVGVEEATFRIGEMLYYGLGAEVDYGGAFRSLKYYEDEFDESLWNDAPAKVHYLLATMYNEGLGVEKNPDEAQKLFSAAKKGGYTV